MRSDGDGGENRLHAIVALASRLLPWATSVTAELASGGVSTEVYRVWAGEQTLYVRVLPEANAGFAPEALAHHLARARGASAPQVIYVDECHQALERAVMVTRAVPGNALAAGSPSGTLPDVLTAAGRDLALINGIPVGGFGWLRRDVSLGATLLGEHATYADWALADVEVLSEAIAVAGLLSASEATFLRHLVLRGADWPAPTQACLAHGDFDCTHIYHRHGHYTGIIDFGEIRGAELTYDLGQFWVEHPELLPHLLAGYAQVTPLPSDHMRLIGRSALLIALRRLGRRFETGRDALPQDVRAVQAVLAGGI